MSGVIWAQPDGSKIGDEWLGSADFASSAAGLEPEGLTDGMASPVRNTKVPPYSQVCHVFSKPRAGVDLGSPGSGFLFGAAVVVTAAHNLFDEKSMAWFEELDIAPGRSGQEIPFGMATVPLRQGTVAVPEAWVKTVKAARAIR
jgi:hypothetical protein